MPRSDRRGIYGFIAIGIGAWAAGIVSAAPPPEWRPAAIAARCKASGSSWHLIEVLNEKGELAVAKEVAEGPETVEQALNHWIPSSRAYFEKVRATTQIAEGTYDLGLPERMGNQNPNRLPGDCEIRFLARFLSDGRRIFLDRELLAQLPERERTLAELRARMAVLISKDDLDSQEIFLRAWFQRRASEKDAHAIFNGARYSGLAPAWAGLPISNGPQWTEFEFGLSDTYGTPPPTLAYLDGHFFQVSAFSADCGSLSAWEATPELFLQQCEFQFTGMGFEASSNQRLFLGILDPTSLRDPFKFRWRGKIGSTLTQVAPLYDQKAPHLRTKIETPWFGKRELTFSSVNFDGKGVAVAGKFYFDSKPFSVAGLGPDSMTVTGNGDGEVIAEFRGGDSASVLITAEGPSAALKLAYLGKSYSAGPILEITRPKGVAALFSFQSLDPLDSFLDTTWISSRALGCKLKLAALAGKNTLQTVQAACEGEAHLAVPKTSCRRNWTYTSEPGVAGSSKLYGSGECDPFPYDPLSVPGLVEIGTTENTSRSFAESRWEGNFRRHSIRIIGRKFATTGGIWRDTMPESRSVSASFQGPATLPGIPPGFELDTMNFSKIRNETKLELWTTSVRANRVECVNGSLRSVPQNAPVQWIWTPLRERFFAANHHCVE
jgi:hypothetical protein